MFEKTDYRMITYNILLASFALNVVYGMVLLDGSTLHLDHLLQKSLRYKHHKEKYIRSLNEGIVPVGLHLNKKTAFVPVSENFEKKWKTVLLNAEKDLVQFLLVESDKVIAKIKFEIESNLKKDDPFNSKKNYQLLEKKRDKYRSYLKEGRDRKWKKFKERYKPNILNVGISESESTSSFHAMSEKEKTTNRAKELQELSELKSVAERPLV